MSFKSGLAVFAIALAALPAAALAESCGETLLAEGERLHGQGRVDLVVAKYTQALETCELSDALAAHIHARRGIANYVMGNMEGAAADYSASLELADSRSTLILMKRASAYLALGDNERAIADIDEGITLEPDKGALYLMRMNANRRLGNMEAVEADFALIEASGDMSTMWAAYKFMGLDPNVLTQ